MASPHITRPNTRLPGCQGSLHCSPRRAWLPPPTPPTPPPRPCRGLHPWARWARPGPPLSRTARGGDHGTLFPPRTAGLLCSWGPAAPRGSTDSDGLARGDSPPHRRPGKSRPGQQHGVGTGWVAGTTRPMGGTQTAAQGSGACRRHPERPDFPPTLRPMGSAAPGYSPIPGQGDTSPTHWDQRAAPGLRSKTKGHNVTCSRRGAHTPPPRAHALG